LYSITIFVCAKESVKKSPRGDKSMRRVISVWIRPDPKLKKEVSAIIKAFSEKYKVYKAFNEWKGPHITVFAMESDYNNIKNITSKAKNAINTVKPFKVYVKDVGYFMKADSTGKRNYVIFLKIRHTRPLHNLWRIFNENFKEYRISFPKYVPHMTITLNDLDKKTFYTALKEYKNFKFSRDFVVNEVKLSTRKRNIKEIEVHTIKLKG
jgi:2'-5' RNA ligase